MTIFFSLIAILQSFSISLGVGTSTLAISTFFVSIADGSISPDERRMMGVVYVVLRVAMVLILVTTLILQAALYAAGAWLPFHAAQLFLILLLFINAMLMTAHLIPSNFGPAIQAGSWYTLGLLAALVPLGLMNFSLAHFFMAYVTWVLLVIGLVNAIMAFLMAKRNKLIK
jgi:hypothetical protein